MTLVFRLVAISLRQLLRLLLLRCRSSRSKDLELLVLRQEIDVMRRQVPRPRFRPKERMVLSVLVWLRPAKERLSSLVTPRHCRWSSPSAARLPPTIREAQDHFLFSRGNATSSRRRWIVAATGMAIRAPMRPSSVPPIKVAMMVSPGEILTVCFITRGLSR